jgi:hypothetical protein
LREVYPEKGLKEFDLSESLTEEETDGSLILLVASAGIIFFLGALLGKLFSLSTIVFILLILFLIVFSAGQKNGKKH